MADIPSRAASPAYVNKLLVELNAANSELEKIKNGNLEQRDNLSADVIALQDELQATKTELELVRSNLKTRGIAKESLNLRPQLRDWRKNQKLNHSSASRGRQTTCVPFVSEMEEDLAASESRIRLLSDQFASEQSKPLK